MHSHSLHCQHCLESPPDSATTQQKLRNLWIALGVISTFSIAELIVSHSSHSLALLADAGHLLSDSGSMAIALFATWMARRPGQGQASFGYRRIEIVAALVNGVGLAAIALWILLEAIARIQAPATEIVSESMLITALVGLGVASLNATLLHSHAQQDLNLRGAFLHMVADAASAVGVMVAALLVWAFHWAWADVVMSILVSIGIGIGCVPLIGQSLRILLEQAPAHLNVDQIRQHLSQFEGVLAVEQLRVWTIALGQDAVSVVLIVNLVDGAERDRLLTQLHTSLQQEFGIHEIVIQMSLPVAPAPVNLSLPQRLESRII